MPRSKSNPHRTKREQRTRLFRSPFVVLPAIGLAIFTLILLPQIIEMPARLALLLLALGMVALGGFVWYFGIKNGELYLIGTPVNRVREPDQFWFTIGLSPNLRTA